MKLPWISKYESLRQGLIDIKLRKEGKIKSFKTPWASVNDAGTNGIEFGSITICAGRPGSGKTLIKDNIIRDSKKYNPDIEFDILDFSLEMSDVMSSKREFGAVVQKSYQEISSSYKELDDYSFTKLKAYTLTHKNTNIFTVYTPPTVDEFENIIHQFMEYRCEKIVQEDGSIIKKYKNLLLTYDHATLTKNKSGGSGNKTDTLQELGERCTDLKKIYPIAFFILSQLNRECENPERNEDGKYGNYVLDSDLFAGDALLQHADLLIGINCPSKRMIRFYGPERYIINPRTIVMHFLKVRNGDIRMSFFENRFEHMTLIETAAPARSIKVKV